jgi:hypothetical protein
VFVWYIFPHFDVFGSRKIWQPSTEEALFGLRITVRATAKRPGPVITHPTEDFVSERVPQAPAAAVGPIL